MQFLFLFFILISCTDNKQSTNTTQSISNTVEITKKITVEQHITNSIFFDYIPQKISTKPNPEYTNSSDLFWLDGFLGDNGTVCEYAREIYYLPISNYYYNVTTAKTNGLKVDYNIPDEQMYIEFKISTNRLRYVGSIDFTNRVYIDNISNQYVKHLSLIDDSTFVWYNNNTKTEVPLESPVYPHARRYEGGGTNLTIRYFNGSDDFWRGSDYTKLMPICGG